MKIDIHEQVPVEQVFGSLDQHFLIHQEITALRKSLEDRTLQYRVVEKRLLARMKETNPSPLNNLDFLLNQTYYDICALASKVEDLEGERKLVAHSLASGLLTLATCLRYKHGLSDEAFDVLRAHLSVSEGREEGWDETTHLYASVTSLLKTKLAKSSKEATGVSLSSLKSLTSRDKMKKHIVILCDRIMKGASLT